MKKILCLLFASFMLVSVSFASEQKDFLKYIKKNYGDFKIQQTDYSKNSLYKFEIEKEYEFKDLYKNYIDYYKNIAKHYSENKNISFNYKYVKKHEKEYKKYGLGFNITEGEWEIEEDYSMLIDTMEIPENWFDWLVLQEKYITENRENCIKMLKKGYGCEGGTMTIPETEQAIVDLEKLEQKSEVIASIKSQDYDYIPYTSRELIDTYLMGNDLKPIFDWNKDDTKKLNEESKKSFEHFIKHHKNSKYRNIINEYYTKLKQNNFLYSPYINGWLIDKLESMK